MIQQSVLSSGLGVCTPSHRLAVKVTDAAVEMGALPDVIRAVFRAVHTVNRHAKNGNYLAIVLPGSGAGEGITALGTKVVVFGSEEAIQTLLDSGSIIQMKRRGSITARAGEVDLSEVSTGTVLMRTRQVEKAFKDPATVKARTERQARRDEKRADHIAKTKGQFPKARPAMGRKTAHRTGFISIKPGLTLDVISRAGAYTGAPIMVSTYGLSSLSAPAVLPEGYEVNG